MRTAAATTTTTISASCHSTGSGEAALLPLENYVEHMSIYGPHANPSMSKYIPKSVPSSGESRPHIPWTYPNTPFKQHRDLSPLCAQCVRQTYTQTHRRTCRQTHRPTDHAHRLR